MIKKIVQMIMNIPSMLLGIISFVFSIFFVWSISYSIGKFGFMFVPKDLYMKVFEISYTYKDILSSEILISLVYCISFIYIYLVRLEENFRFFTLNLKHYLFKFLIVSYGICGYLVILIDLKNSRLDYLLFGLFPFFYIAYLYIFFSAMQKINSNTKPYIVFQIKFGRIEYFACIFNIIYFIYNKLLMNEIISFMAGSMPNTLMQASIIYILILIAKFAADPFFIIIKAWYTSEDRINN
jgi:hypothetical protein